MGKSPLTFRRLVGLDRSGGPPPETRRGEPLHPWTIPNAIGVARLLLIPVFLVLALGSGDGRDTVATILFAFVAATDWFDGMAARITGQYSRLGALLDPLTDRLLILSGAVVAYHFELLPRWALLVLAAREAFMLAVGPFLVRRGVELRINWPGRLSVLPIMSSIFFGLCGLKTLAAILLYVGLALSLTATFLYGRTAVRELSSST